MLGNQIRGPLWQQYLAVPLQRPAKIHLDMDSFCFKSSRQFGLLGYLQTKNLRVHLLHHCIFYSILGPIKSDGGLPFQKET